VAHIPEWLLPHRVTVKALTGNGAYGPEYATGVPNVPCMLDDSRKLVRNGDGDEVVSETTLICRLQHAALFTPGSEVTLPRRTAHVIGVAERTDDDMGAWQHLEVTLS